MQRTINNSARNATEQSRVFVRVSVLLSIILLIFVVTQFASAQPADEEYKVKAAFLFHFAQLVDWPAGALNQGDQSLNLCVFDDEPRLLELQGTLEGKLVATRTLHVRSLSQPQGAQGCNILFLSRDEARREGPMLKSLRGQPILTVGETESFMANGGMIRLHLEKDKIRFDINAGAADSSHLKISSRLLLLATTVILGGATDRGR